MARNCRLPRCSDFVRGRTVNGRSADVTARTARDPLLAVWPPTPFDDKHPLGGQRRVAVLKQRGTMAWDRVHTVNEYYDGPRLGIADVDGVPHIYEAEFDHSSDEYGNTYFVSPVDESLLALVLEDWEIWLRWDLAFKRGDVSVESHPALPQDRERH